MKRIIAGVILLIAIGCKAPMVMIGMSEQDFISANRGAKMVKAANGQTVYRKTTQPFGSPAETRFYYFVNGKLVQMDEGQRNPDILIQNNRN